MERDTHFVLGVYEDEDVLLDAVKQVRSSGVKIHEVYSPYPVTAWSTYWVIREVDCLLQHSYSEY